MKNGKVIKSETENFKVKVYNPEKLHKKLEEVRFANVRKLKPYDKEQNVDEKDELIVFECQKYKE